MRLLIQTVISICLLAGCAGVGNHDTVSLLSISTIGNTTGTPPKPGKYVLMTPNRIDNVDPLGNEDNYTLSTIATALVARLAKQGFERVNLLNDAEYIIDIDWNNKDFDIGEAYYESRPIYGINYVGPKTYSLSDTSGNTINLNTPGSLRTEIRGVVTERIQPKFMQEQVTISYVHLPTKNLLWLQQSTWSNAGDIDSWVNSSQLPLLLPNLSDGHVSESITIGEKERKQLDSDLDLAWTNFYTASDEIRYFDPSIAERLPRIYYGPYFYIPFDIDINDDRQNLAATTYSHNKETNESQYLMYHCGKTDNGVPWHAFKLYNTGLSQLTSEMTGTDVNVIIAKLTIQKHRNENRYLENGTGENLRLIGEVSSDSSIIVSLSNSDYIAIRNFVNERYSEKEILGKKYIGYLPHSYIYFFIFDPSLKNKRSLPISTLGLREVFQKGDTTCATGGE